MASPGTLSPDAFEARGRAPNADDTVTTTPETRRVELPRCTRTDCSDSHPNSPWSRKLILSLDGGGIKGYSSLLILKRLMFLVSQIERGNRANEKSQPPTYHPPNNASEDYPWYVASGEHAEEQGPERINGEGGDEAALSTSVELTFNAETRLTFFKPHHYFDYIVGTSTGGLSAVMLGRMEMTIETALEQYDVVGNKVFGRPRFLHPTFNFTNYIQPKYPSRRMAKAIQRVIKTGLSEELGRSEISEKTVSFEANDRRTRTIAVAFGPSNTALYHAYLFRTYDHPGPPPFLHNNAEEQRHLNPGKAHRDPIWQIARATSAAPKYFSSITFRNLNFRDGGMIANNPASLAYKEVRQMHNQLPKLLLSIGTGAPQMQQQNNPQDAQPTVSYIGDWGNIVKLLAQLATQSHQTHLDLDALIVEKNEHLQGPNKIKYYRLNEDAGVRDIALDQWQPSDTGRTTKDEMLRLTKTYLKKPDVHIMLLKCAREMVKIRRLRARTDRWEEFARNFTYHCPEKECKKVAATFATREALRIHLAETHSYVIDVRIQNHDGLKHVCNLDQCSQSGFLVFQTEPEYLRHLKEHHNIDNDRLIGREELEAHLDKCRMTPAQEVDFKRKGTRAPTLRKNRNNGAIQHAQNGTVANESTSSSHLRGIRQSLNITRNSMNLAR